MKKDYKKLKILELPSWYIPDGGEFVQEQSLALRKAGMEVAIAANVALSWKKYKWSIIKFPHREFSIYEKDLLTYRYYMRRRPMSEKHNVEKWIRKTLFVCEEYIKEQGLPDILHVHSALWAGYVAAILKEKYGIPYVITEHRGRFSEKSQLNETQIAEMDRERLERAFSNADHIIAVSSLLIKKIKSYCLREIPISVISNMLHTDSFPYTERHPHEKFRFICVNHYEHLKGQDLLIRAFEKLCEHHPECELCLVGRNFSKKSFQKILSSLKHKDKIIFTGPLPQEKVSTELQQADAFVLPSRIESESIAVLEAMSTGLPVVATEVVPSEVVTPAVGFLVPVEDIDALAEAMDKMVAHYTTFQPFEIATHVRALASQENVIPQLLDIFNSVSHD